MKYRIWSYDGAIKIQAGAWEALPNDGIQRIIVEEDGGTQGELVGFDHYWKDGDQIGVVITDPATPYRPRHFVWSIIAGKLVPEESDGRVPLRAQTKRGTWVPDDVAREIGIKV